MLVASCQKSPSLLRVLFLAAVLAFGFCGPAAAVEFSTVVIDPGHGGRDNGASWYGVDEKDLALDVAKRVESILRKKGVATAMTRRKDEYVSLDDRAAISNRFANSIFVSIHFNAHTDRSVRGIETFYSSPAGKEIAAVVQKAVTSKITNTRNRGIKKGSYAVLLRTKSPAILVEGGFISNLSESKKCQTEWYRQTLAEAIARAILQLK